MTLLESPWAPTLPARASQRRLPSSFFTIWPFSRNPLCVHLLGEEPLGLLLICMAGMQPSKPWAWSHHLPASFPMFSMRTHSSDAWKRAFRTLQLLREADSDSVSEAWESVFLTTSQVMLMLLVCGQSLRGQELGPHNLLSELSSPGCFCSWHHLPCNIKMRIKECVWGT